MTDIISNETIHLKVVETKGETHGSNEWRRSCHSCDKVFYNGDKRIEWRLNIQTPNKYHTGSFWTRQCPECVAVTMTNWSNALININLNSFLPTPEV